MGASPFSVTGAAEGRVVSVLVSKQVISNRLNIPVKFLTWGLGWGFGFWLGYVRVRVGLYIVMIQ